MKLANLARVRNPLYARRDMRSSAARQFLVGGNWKCNGSVESVQTLVSELNSGSLPDNVEVVCAPTFVHLPMVKDKLNSRFQISAQNCWTAPGAYTGEVSADMLANMGIPWVITGHSERRALCGESSAQVGEKTAYAISKGLKVIACVGETLPQRESGELWNVLAEQMSALKDSVALGDWGKVVIAYEPVWAIGTGVVATPEQAQVRDSFYVVQNFSIHLCCH
jgi:triosephosphate isomerase (TIM)